jgi:YegS/Rv2252/BmrU family lipid kinase
MTAYVVVNPRAGRTSRDWPAIREGLTDAFPLMQVAESRGRGDTARLVRAALQDGHLDIVVVGGDGTINEAVNGFFEQGRPLSPEAVLGFVATGRTNDFARNFDPEPNFSASIARLKKSHIRRIDVGRLSCLSLEGQPLTRYFLNAASFGLGARIAQQANRAGPLAERMGFAIRAALSLIGWRSPRLRLIADQLYDEIAGITMVAIANGRWFAGGRELAPAADLCDGKFDIVIAGGMPRRKMLKRLFSLANPTGMDLRAVRAARFTAAPTLDTGERIEIETDGESAGLLPATLEILPAALNLRV